MAVYRCYTERRLEYALEEADLLVDLQESLGIEAEFIRIFNRYDIEGIDEATYAVAKNTILSEPQTDVCYDEFMPSIDLEHVAIAIEALPGQYDQRADSCAQCIQMLTLGERPVVKSAKIYIFGGSLSSTDVSDIKNYLINPVESREAEHSKPETLHSTLNLPSEVETLNGFIQLDVSGLLELLDEYSLAMDFEDLKFLQNYFISEDRDPTITELRVIDTYWSDHCRHTTFLTHIDDIQIDDAEVTSAYAEYLSARDEVYGEKSTTRPVTLMDIATIGAKVLKKRGLLDRLDESEEINACSVHVEADVNGEKQDWLLMFKNETHNHPTEIEPFGGAATCLGGAIRDPLSGRSYVYQAMRVTGSGDPTKPISETLEGKLAQKKITTTAAAGYSSYGNQIGLATGLVHEIYHEGYVAKRMEIGAVVGAAPAENVVRKAPEPGDIVMLLGGKTGRDGCGGATGSSKTHTAESITESASEVQKGNPPEERKIQRLFRKPEVSKLIKRCNDFGAGGVSVAIGELADGLKINLDLVPKKYEGLDGTELAISESQERMAVVIAPEHKDILMTHAYDENLEATVVAEVTSEPRLRMNWNGQTIVDLSRSFLDSNGAEKHTDVKVTGLEEPTLPVSEGSVKERLLNLVSDLNVASQRGLGEMFDSSIGASTVIMPYGGKYQRTPAQSMAALLPAEAPTTTCSVMSFAFDPYLSEVNTYRGAVSAVVSSVAKLVAAGCDYSRAFLTFQEYFERLRGESQRWGKPFSALLGALSAQLGLGIASIGGKDSMSGSFLDMDVPPTLVSFAIADSDARNIISPEFKLAGNSVYAFEVPSVFDYDALKKTWSIIHSLIVDKKIVSAWSVGSAGIAEGLAKMAFGNGIGFKSLAGIEPDYFFGNESPVIIVESTGKIEGATFIGRTTAEQVVELANEKVSLSELLTAWEAPLEKVFKTKAPTEGAIERAYSYNKNTLVSTSKFAKPRVIIPVFPGTNCEYDTARAVEEAGGSAEVFVIKNLTSASLEESVLTFEKLILNSQMLILPGGFSGGDEPDGCAKFITSFFRNPALTDAVHTLLYKNDGLILGICNGFQALVKLGLLPGGEIRPMDSKSPTLTQNVIRRHQSKYVLTRTATVASPWLSLSSVGDIYGVPVSHGEGRFAAPQEVIDKMISDGNIAFQYVDHSGTPSMDVEFNPNGSSCAIEGLISPDGRILGKMGHTERTGSLIAKNIPFPMGQPLFQSGVNYYK